MAEKVKRLGVYREVGYLYYVDRQGDVSRAKMARGGGVGSKPEKVRRVGVKKTPGYLYFLDKNGDISRAKMVNVTDPPRQIAVALPSALPPGILGATIERLRWQEQTRRFVFLSYSHKDSKVVSSFNSYLKAKGINAWFDKKQLKGGQDWEQEIKKAIGSCVLFVTFLSHNSVSSKGFFQSEAKLAQKAWEKIPEGRPYIIPVMIEEGVPLPESLGKIHVVPFQSPLKSKRELLEAIKYHLESSLGG